MYVSLYLWDIHKGALHLDVLPICCVNSPKSSSIIGQKVETSQNSFCIKCKGQFGGMNILF